jgi:hypothetical protein
MTKKLLISCMVHILCFYSSVEFSMEEREPAIALDALERGIGTSGMESLDIATILTNKLSITINPANFRSLVNHIESTRKAETLDIQRAHFLEIIHILKGPNASKDPERIANAIIQLLPTPDGDPLDDAIKNALRRVLRSGTEKDESSGMNDLFAMIQSSDDNMRLRKKIRRYKKIFGVVTAIAGAVTTIAGAVAAVLPFILSSKECNCDCSSE